MITVAVACEKDPDKELFADLTRVSYQVSDEIIPNPERGFYSPTEVYHASNRTLSQAALESARRLGNTLFLLEYHLMDYVNSDIADEYLDMIRRDFGALRQFGGKCVLRFAYSNGNSEDDKPWDATEEQVLRHIAQLKPLLQENYDVILVVQAGFIGSWGEWYYTDNFNSVLKTDEDYLPRKHVVDALLDAVPDCRQVALRTPSFKMKMYGYALADTITRATAHQPTTKARLAAHNDCYLASSNDTGTYNGTADRSYWQAESPYIIMGGETCGKSIYCHCGPQEGDEKAHGVLVDMALYHFTYLNISFHQGVISRWKTEGCFEEIQKRLGYRYSLTAAGFTSKPAAGNPFRAVLKIQNSGFASAQNPRDAELILTDNSGSVLATWPIESDPRYWMPGTTVVDQTVNLPSGISGEVTLWLNLPDPCTTLRDNPRFSIRLANNGTWDENTGYNKLHTFSL